MISFDYPVKVAIVGSRDYKWLTRVIQVVNELPDGSTVVSGGARGVDSIAESTARGRGLHVESHIAEWDKYGKSAGMIRNSKIVRDCSVVIAFWDGKSKGTLDTITKATLAGKTVIIESQAGYLDRDKVDSIFRGDA